MTSVDSLRCTHAPSWMMMIWCSMQLISTYTISTHTACVGYVQDQASFGTTSRLLNNTSFYSSTRAIQKRNETQRPLFRGGRRSTAHVRPSGGFSGVFGAIKGRSQKFGVAKGWVLPVSLDRPWQAELRRIAVEPGHDFAETHKNWVVTCMNWVISVKYSV